MVNGGRGLWLVVGGVCGWWRAGSDGGGRGLWAVVGVDVT